MPTYQYACTACGHQLEVVQSFSDAALTQCPECEGRLRKLFSAVGIVFKGSGFYRTDSRSGTSSDAAAASSTSPNGGGGNAGSSGSSESSSSATKTESAPAKSESKSSSTTTASATAS